jgi:hypothetical protein
LFWKLNFSPSKARFKAKINVTFPMHRLSQLPAQNMPHPEERFNKCLLCRALGADKLRVWVKAGAVFFYNWNCPSWGNRQPVPVGQIIDQWRGDLFIQTSSYKPSK